MTIFKLRRTFGNRNSTENTTISAPDAKKSKTYLGSINNLRTSPQYAVLADIIRQKSKGRKIVYAPSYGNWGDALIQQGTLQFLQDSGIQYTTLTRPKINMMRETISSSGLDFKDAILLSCGGGSWCKNFHGNRDFVDRNHDLFAETIVLPSTYELPRISGGKSNITYVARDEFESQTLISEALFCHDMAFYIEIAENIGVESMSDIGYFFRQDSEKNQSATPMGPGYDISLVGNQNSKIKPFFHILNGYNKIVTDRMHVAIAGAMLGKEVELFSGDYFKAQAVFKSSIEPYYPNVSLKSWNAK